MASSDLIKRLHILKNNPEFAKPLDTNEIQQLLLIFLDNLTKLGNALDRGKLKGDPGYTPQPDKDYITTETAKRHLENLFTEAAEAISNTNSTSYSALSESINKRLAEIRDGKDAEITPELISQIAAEASSLIELPNFKALITQENRAIRDGLELLPDGEKLRLEAIEGLPNKFQELEKTVTERARGSAGGSFRHLTRMMDITNATGATSGQVLAKNSSGGFTFVTASGTGDMLAANNLSDVASAATARQNLDLEIGVDVQAYDAELTQIAGLADPNADRLLFWDDSAGSYAYLTVGSNLTITGTTLDATGGGSGITRTVVTTSGSATAGSTASTDYVYFVAGAHTMSLPSPNTNRYTFKNNHSANVTIDTAGAELIEGAASISLAPEESVDIISDGTNWYII